MAATLALYRTRFPEHADVDDTEIEMYLGDAISDVSSPVYGNDINRAQLYYAAHLVESSPTRAGGAAVGPIKSQSVGGVSLTFSDAADSDSSDLNSTKYGKEFIRLRDSLFMGGLSV